MKYKVGDKVRIVKEICSDGFSVGDVVVISLVGGSCYEILKGDSTWGVSEEEIEPVGKETEKGNKMLEVGKTYVDKQGKHATCIHVGNKYARLAYTEQAPAYVWDKFTGKALGLIEDYDIQTETVFKEV